MEPLYTGLTRRSPSFLFTTRCGCFSLSSPGTQRDTLSGDHLLSVSWLPLVMLNYWPSVAESSLLYGLMGSVFLGSIVLSLPQAAGSSRMEKGMRPNHILGTRKVPVSPSRLASAPAQGWTEISLLLSAHRRSSSQWFFWAGLEFGNCLLVMGVVSKDVFLPLKHLALRFEANEW